MQLHLQMISAAHFNGFIADLILRLLYVAYTNRPHHCFPQVSSHISHYKWHVLT